MRVEQDSNSGLPESTDKRQFFLTGKKNPYTNSFIYLQNQQYLLSWKASFTTRKKCFFLNINKYVAIKLQTTKTISPGFIRGIQIIFASSFLFQVLTIFQKINTIKS